MARGFKGEAISHMIIVRRKDPPAYPDAPNPPWKTVATRKTIKEAREFISIMKTHSSPFTKWWWGEEHSEDDQVLPKEPE